MSVMKEDLSGLKYNLKELGKRVYLWLKSPVFRVHLLKIITGASSIILLISAYHIHVTYADEFVAFQLITTTTDLNRNVSRGLIFDRNMIPLVVNDTVSVVTYQHVPNTSVNEIRRVANELSKMIYLSYEDDIYWTLMFRDRQELFLMLNEDYVRSLVADMDTSGLSNAQFHLLMIDQITQDHIQQLTHDELQAHAIFVRMFQGAGTTANVIKENPTESEIAAVVENLINLPGVNVGTDWTRMFPSGVSRDFFGNVTNAQQGIPRERAAYFLQQGYAANARVGTSQLELSLQKYLSGFQYRYSMTGVNSVQTSPGLPGFHVTLNLDSELQKMIENLVAEELLYARANQRVRRYLRETYVVVSNPNTGAVLAMVGVVLEEDEDGELAATMNPLGTIHSATQVGSAVKGASLALGYATGITQVGQRRHDSVINIRYSNPFRSWTNMGTIDDITALRRSSNVYFYRQTMELAGVHHTQGGPILNWTDDNQAWEIKRNFFWQLGLGSYTGIELSNESRGFNSGNSFSELLFLSIGQADTYTAMQLAQFGAVLATQGDRMQMQLVQNIYLPSNEKNGRQLIQGFQPNLLNRIELTQEQWDTISEGHRQVVHHPQGTAYWAFRDTNFSAAGKTGTAETFLRNENGFFVDRDGNVVGTEDAGGVVYVNNSTFVAYAPYYNPQIVVSVISPQAMPTGAEGGGNIARDLARDIMGIYFDLQLSRSGD